MITPIMGKYILPCEYLIPATLGTYEIMNSDINMYHVDHIQCQIS